MSLNRARKSEPENKGGGGVEVPGKNHTSSKRQKRNSKKKCMAKQPGAEGARPQKGAMADVDGGKLHSYPGDEGL